jgi:hypothetical protein
VAALYTFCKESEKKHMRLRKKYVFIGTMGIIVLVLLAGSFVFLFQKSYQQPEHTSLRPGWRQIASFSGTGSKLIKWHETLPHLWGNAISCTGGNLDIEADGIRTKLTMGQNPCVIPSPALSPQSIEYDVKSLTIESLKITTTGSTMWHIEFVQEEKASNFQLGSEWVPVMGMGSVGAPVDGVLSNVAPTARNWGLVVVCVGSGSISGQVLPVPSAEPVFPATCDDEPRLLKVQYPSPVAIQEVKMTPSKNILFYVYVVACTNQQQC